MVKTEEKCISVIIIEDFKLTRVGLRCALNANKDINVVAEAEDATEGLKLIEKYKYSHENLEEESSELLKQMGKAEKEPGMMATAFSWLSTETKLIMKNTILDGIL